MTYKFKTFGRMLPELGFELPLEERYRKQLGLNLGFSTSYQACWGHFDLG